MALMLGKEFTEEKLPIVEAHDYVFERMSVVGLHREAKKRSSDITNP
jgi:hypothetical protein